MNDIRSALAKAISNDTGLKIETVLDLIQSNWSYIQKLNEPQRWVKLG